MECGAFTVHRQAGIVSSADHPSVTEGGRFFIRDQPSAATAY